MVVIAEPCDELCTCGVQKWHCAKLLARFASGLETRPKREESYREDVPILALPKKRPLLVEDEGGGGL